VILASITDYFIQLNLYEFSFIIFCSFGVDFDFLFRRFEKKGGGDHRNFFTHTVYPGLFLVIVGIILAFYHYHLVWIGGLAYLSHILFDCIDTGLKLFYTDKYYGWFLLITQDEKNLGITYRKIIDREIKEDEYFILKRYYKNKTILLLDITVSVIGFALLFTFSSEFWWMYIGFFLLLEYHLYHKKKAAKGLYRE
jgi:hypothetical protein